MPVSNGIDVYNFNDATKYLDGTGNYSVPPGSGGASINTAPDCYVLPYGLSTLSNEQVTGTLTANFGWLGMFQIPVSVTFTKMSINVFATTNGTNAYLGLYTLGGTGIVQAKYPLTASTGKYTQTVASTTITPGTYWMMFAADDGTNAVNLFGATNGGVYVTSLLNATQVRNGFKATQVVAGALVTPITPSTFTKNNQPMPQVLLEP
jgi:hypothetical protein